jgi:AGCS family alanine or glycine:cation symporter
MDSFLETIINTINSYLSLYFLIPALLLVGFYFSFKTNWVQFRLFKEMFRLLADSSDNKEGGISSFQAFTISLGQRVGTGNMAGVALAIFAGGPGAIFWMWIIALVGAASAFAESTLAQIYKVSDGPGLFKGGPAYYMQQGLNSRTMGIVFAILLILTDGFVFNAVQSNTISVAFENSFGFKADILAGVLVLITGLIIFGGIRRIASFSNIVVPIMAIAYLLVVFYVLLVNFEMIPGLISLIVESAFGLREVGGGMLGAALVQGIKRGLFSNEAGMGTAPNAAATADVSHPVKQGLIQALGVFTDTLIICTATALLILISKEQLAPELGGIELTQEALVSEVGAWGAIFISVCIFLFGFSSVIGNYYYGESNIKFISGKKSYVTIYRVLVLGMVLFGALASSSIVWSLADIMMILVALLNLYAIVRLSKYVVAALKDYVEKRKSGAKTDFKADDIGLKNELESW